MPTYEYRCKACNNDLEVFQKFSDDPLTTCPECQGELRRVFSPAGIVFKGSGFYSTDSRKSSSFTGSSTSKPKETAKAKESSKPKDTAKSSKAA